jgi:hypothetical protein
LLGCTHWVGIHPPAAPVDLGRLTGSAQGDAGRLAAGQTAAPAELSSLRTSDGQAIVEAYGLPITIPYVGPAAERRSRLGDVILAVCGSTKLTIDAMKAVLAGTGGAVEVTVLSASTGQQSTAVVMLGDADQLRASTTKARDRPSTSSRRCCTGR